MALPEILSCEAMRAAEARAMVAGTPSLRLMERAGRAVADVVSTRFPAAKRVAVLAGPGNNGGDGYVVARALAGRGHAVTVFAGAPTGKPDGDAARMARQWQGATESVEEHALRHFAPDLIVDALFGIGLSRAPEGSLRELIEAANGLRAAGAVIVAVDIPSGYAGDDGQASGVSIAADLTVTFHALKPAHVLQPARDACGEIVVADIGLAAAASPRIVVNGRPALLDEPPETSAHKYDHGHALVLAGGLEGTGAARLAARAALRAGAGLVTLGVPGSALIAHAGREPDALMVRRADGEDGLAGLLADKRRNAVVIGPAYGVGEATRAAVETVLRAGRKAVLDADALTSFAGHAPQLGDLIRSGGSNVVVTPHAGEFANLFKAMGEGAESSNQGLRSTSKIEQALAAAGILGAVVVYKGADTVIAAPDGRAAVNVNAPPWLATAGSGDVLAGIIGGLLARGVPAFEAACAAVWLHGEAGTKAGRGLIADDLPEALYAVLRGA